MDSSRRRCVLSFMRGLILGLIVFLIPGLTIAQVTLPAKIQAEDYDDQSGVATTTTSDVDGEDDLYMLAGGDWAEYDVTAPSTGDYTFTIRVKSVVGSGNYFRIEVDDEDVTGTIGPSSDSYEDVVVGDIELTSGSHTIKYYHVSSWNWNSRVNWIEITPESPPTVAFTSASQPKTEGDGTATVTAELSFATDSTVTVPFTLGGTATETTDYSITSSPITISAGQTTGTATITIVDDSLDESDETVIVTMGTPTNATQGTTTVHTVTITDNDTAPTVSFTSASQSPGEGAGTATVTAQLSAASGLTVTVPFTLGGTATESTDYTISASPITITAGQTTGTATITITDDSLDENDETVIVTMGTPTNATQGATTVHTVTITDNDTAPTVSFTSASQSPGEGAGTATVTAQLSAASGLTVTVPFTLGGTATESTDYTISASPITITAGQTTGTATITITDDSLDENDETVIVTMGTPTNATQGATTVHTLTITDNDATPTVTFTSASQSQDEDVGTATVTAQLSAASGLAVTVPFTLGGTATENTDYTITSSPITISAGQTTGTATVTITDDTSVESNETVIVTMGTPTNATQGAITAHTLTITDDDSSSGVTLPAKIQAEDYDDQSGVATTTTGDVDGEDDLYMLASGDWAEYDVTAPSTGDYTFTIRVKSVVGSGNYFRIEVDDEDVTGTVGPSSDNYEDVVVDDIELTSGSHTIKYYHVSSWNWNSRVNWIEITPESSPTVVFTSASQSKSEGDGTATVTAQLSAASGQTVTVPFTLGGTATETTDYSITSSPITISAGQTTGTATITIVDDSLDESDETVIVTMGTPTNATQGATTIHTLTITDDDSSNQTPTVDAGVDQSVSVSAGVTLDATVVDDDLPDPPGLVTVTWTKQEGPGTVTFGDSSAVDTTAAFSASGSYYLRLTADDGSLTAYDEVQITVTSANTAPSVNAGLDQAILVTGSATLDATVSDDGLPSPPGTCTVTWTKQSGPGTVTFGSTSAIDTTVTFDTVGTYVLRLTASDSSLSDYDDLTVTVLAADVFILPCKVEVEDYMDGGQNVGYYDTSSGNYGGVYRTDDVDIGVCTDTGGGYEVGWIDEDEWLAYNVYVPQTSMYTFEVRVKTTTGARLLHIEEDGEDVSGTITTYTMTDWDDVVAENVSLTAGTHVLKIVFDDNWNNSGDRINYFTVIGTTPPTVDAGPDQSITLPVVTVTLDATVTDDGLPDPPGEVTFAWSVVSTPDGGLVDFADSLSVDTTATLAGPGLYVPGTYVLRLTASDGEAEDSDDITITVTDVTSRASLPGRLEAEDYADQGEGVSYHDTTAGNAGSTYRSDDVDIESCGDTGGGYDVYTIAADEWLAFDVDVDSDTSCYDIVARVNSSTSSRQMHVEVDGLDVTGAMTFDSTGGWTDVTAEGIYLAPGSHVVKIVMDTGDFKLNYIDFVAETYEEYIVEDGVANADIVISSSPFTTVDLAAEELQDIIYDITGATLPIVTTPTAADVHIYVGESSYTSSLGLSTTGLEYDAFKIVSGSNWLALIGADTEYVPIEPTGETEEDLEDWDEITGSTYMVPVIGVERNYNEEMDLWQSDGCGSLQAVYEFLRTLGCRWYYPDAIGEISPDIDDIGLPTVNRTVEPDYPLRNLYMYYHQFLKCDEDEVKWQLRLGGNLGHDSRGTTNSHGLNYVLGRDEMKTAHPEYYSLIDDVRQTEGWTGYGWPCLSSTGLLAENVNFAQKFFDHYGEPCVSVSPTDGYAYMCECELCEGKNTPERGTAGDLSDYVTGYCNDVAEEVYLTHPSKKLYLSAYGYYYLPPLQIEELSPNVIMGICRVEHTLCDDTAFQEYRTVVDQWIDTLGSGQIVIRSYYLDSLNDPGNPIYFSHMLRDRFRLYQDGSALGTVVEVGRTYEPNGVPETDWDANATNHLNCYITTRLCWDANLDLDAMLNEYYEKFYGPAAEEMKEFVEYCEATSEYPLTTSSIISTMRTKLNAAITAASGSGVYADRVDLMDEFLSVKE